MDQIRRAACELMDQRQTEEGSCAIADVLASGKWTHDYPITAHEAKQLGLPVSVGIPKEVREIMALFPRPTRRSRTVEFLPARLTRG